MNLQQRLKQIRTEKSLTVEQLSQLLNVPARTISSYERGEHMPPASFLQLLNEHMHANINFLLSGKGAMFVGTDTSSRFEKVIREDLSLSERDIKLLKAIADFLQVARE